MIADATYLATIDAFVAEIHHIITQFNARCNGVTDKTALCDIRLEMIERLRDQLHHQSRALRHMKGEAVEPEHIEATAVLIGFGGVAS